MRFRVKGILITAASCAVSVSSAFGQDKDISELVDIGKEKFESIESLDLKTNEDLLEAARERIRAMELPQVDTGKAGDFFGEEFQIRKIEALQSSAHPSLYVFISFSIKDTLIEEYIADAVAAGGVVVLGGLHNDSFKATVDKISEFVVDAGGASKGGVVIDPKAFETFGVSVVPTILLAKEQLSACTSQYCLRDVPLHDRLTGAVSIEYALRLFSREGDLKAEAKEKLRNISKDIYSVYRE